MFTLKPFTKEHVQTLFLLMNDICSGAKLVFLNTRLGMPICVFDLFTRVGEHTQIWIALKIEYTGMSV